MWNVRYSTLSLNNENAVLYQTGIRGGLGSQTGRGKNIKAALLNMAAQPGSVASEASGACNGWGTGARLRALVGFYTIWGFMQFQELENADLVTIL